MSFRPFKDKIEVKPFEKTSPFYQEGEQLGEAGTVVAVGSEVEGVNVGDIIFFLGYGCWKTMKYEDEEHWVIPNREEFILGTYVVQE